MVVRPRSCERAAEFVSLELDGELSLFERVMLKHHLQRCQPCAAYARDVTSLTELLRSTPVEQIHLSIPLSRPRHRLAGVLQSVAAAAAVIAVGMWAAFSSPGNAHRPGRVGTVNSGSGRSAALYDDQSNWAAGLPRTEYAVRLFPGGLHNRGVNF